ncbi:ATP-binding protein [Flavobacterium sp. WV_118_3]|jgi:hypothetical protein|uniref:sensor histidine kinase n=1 Tax=Flavobacterium sp. WV_118_3 TaxID=3151764 RepID=UPI002C592EF3|nr:histidine kinase [Flavobacterium sp.]
MEQKEIPLLIISFSIVLLTLLGTLLVFFLYFQKKKSKFLMDKMEAELFFNSELAKSRIEIKEQTLSNISRELHDNIGQILSVAVMQLNLMVAKIDTDDKNEIDEVRKLVSKSLDEIRMVAKLINGDVELQSGFIDAVTEDLNRITKLKIINGNLNISGQIQPIDPQHEVIIYRILQEAISNALKYSHSKTIDVDICFDARECIIEVTDSGIGFNNATVAKGSGLANMNTRARLIGAAFLVSSRPNEGTKLKIVYPLEKGRKE